MKGLIVILLCVIAITLVEINDSINLSKNEQLELAEKERLSMVSKQKYIENAKKLKNMSYSETNNKNLKNWIFINVVESVYFPYAIFVILVLSIVIFLFINPFKQPKRD